MKQKLRVLSFMFTVILAFQGMTAKSQKIDSIFFNLYTDSLKKGVHHFNYINVDGKLADGRYFPLDTTHVKFSTTVGQFHGNVLTLDSAIKEAFVTITAVLKQDPRVQQAVTIYIKKNYSDEPLKTQEELIEGWQKKKPATERRRKE